MRGIPTARMPAAPSPPQVLPTQANDRPAGSTRSGPPPGFILRHAMPVAPQQC
jgi:hypothetical protein